MWKRDELRAKDKSVELVSACFGCQPTVFRAYKKLQKRCKAAEAFLITFLNKWL
jgi:hypothetical protein